VVLCAGAYGSPAILLRSGIRPAGELAAVGVEPALDLPGAGRNLHDQPCAEVYFEGSGELTSMMERHQAKTGWRPDEQVIAKFPSAGCRQGFDLHIYPVGGYSRDASKWFWFLGAACLAPLSRGSVREIAEAPELRRLLGRETRPGPEVSGRQAIERFIDHAAVHYYHPAGSCKMGPASDPDSVADSEGRVHGIEGLHVADASLMPAVTSGNTNMPATVIGERIARSLLGRPPPAADGGAAPRMPDTDSRTASPASDRSRAARASRWGWRTGRCRSAGAGCQGRAGTLALCLTSRPLTSSAGVVIPITAGRRRGGCWPAWRRRHSSPAVSPSTWPLVLPAPCRPGSRRPRRHP
jgi:hypothetical protein